MLNPFETIVEHLIRLEEKLSFHNPPSAPQANEIITRDELCKRLAITEPTAIRWEKKGKIPAIRIGSNVRYNWPSVIESLEKRK